MSTPTLRHGHQRGLPRRRALGRVPRPDQQGLHRHAGRDRDRAAPGRRAHRARHRAGDRAGARDAAAPLRRLSRLRAAADRRRRPGRVAAAHRQEPPGHRVGHRAHEPARRAAAGVCEALVAAREKLLAVAGRHTETIIPAYTHGVQAQPTTFAHYLLAFAAALGRQTERMQQVYARVNRNPLGAAALATSSFPLDRRAPRRAARLRRTRRERLRREPSRAGGQRARSRGRARDRRHPDRAVRAGHPRAVRRARRRGSCWRRAS